MPHYFDERPGAATAPGEVVLDVGGRTLRLATDTGVFSRSRLDPGTAVLLRKAPPPPLIGTTLDLGCGYGPIALSLAVQSPESIVWAVDVNERARALVTENAAANAIDNVIVAAPDDVPAGLTFDAIYSNPPIRIGKDALHALLDRWLRRLTPNRADETADPPFRHGAGTPFGHGAGTVRAEPAGALLVVQRHLGADSLHHWLQREGFLTERLASSKGYRVLVVAGRIATVPEGRSR